MKRGSSALLVICLALFWRAPAFAAPPIEAYGQASGISDVVLSPSGTRIALIATDGEERSLYISTTEGKALNITKIGVFKVRELIWAGDDHVLVVATARSTWGRLWHERDELATAFSIDVRSGKSVQIFGKIHGREVANAVRRPFFGTAQIDGHWYGWFGGVTYPRIRPPAI